MTVAAGQETATRGPWSITPPDPYFLPSHPSLLGTGGDEGKPFDAFLSGN